MFDQAVPLLADAAKRPRGTKCVAGTAPPGLGTLLNGAPAGGTLADLVVDLTSAKRHWDAVENSWSQIESRRRLLETLGDPIVATYRSTWRSRAWAMRRRWRRWRRSSTRSTASRAGPRSPGAWRRRSGRTWTWWNSRRRARRTAGSRGRRSPPRPIPQVDQRRGWYGSQLASAQAQGQWGALGR